MRRVIPIMFLDDRRKPFSLVETFDTIDGTRSRLTFHAFNTAEDAKAAAEHFNKEIASVGA